MRSPNINHSLAMNAIIHTFIACALFTQICASRNVRAIGFECNGEARSPIIINEVIQTNKFYDFIQTKSHDAEPTYIKLTKHSDMGFLRMDLGYAVKNWPKIIGGPLNTSYIFQHVDFHWGEHDRVGSEHHILDTQYPMEIQAVYYNEKYASLVEAIGKLDGVAVVSYFARVSRKPHPAVGRLLEKFHVLSNAGTQSVNLAVRFPLSRLLEYFKDDYYTYQGTYTKLDYKPCAYNVHWIIRAKPVVISEGQMKMFRGLAEKSPLFLNNYSEVEPQHNRTVYFQTKLKTDKDCGCVKTPDNQFIFIYPEIA